MSKEIDKRIVEMSFENHKFEKGIRQSQKSLKNLANSLSDSKLTDKNLSGLDGSVQTITKSFSALEQIGIGALRRIGEVAVNTGMRVVRGLAIDPILQGYAELDLKMNSTQTIMASTGETLSVVNGYLRELNEYSDKTIYSFSDMTQNIGKFTNAGVKLDMAVASIKGISNAAALAGANSWEASRAMYNFAQALSSGYVKLIDWKSIELANMATVEFKTQLLEAAVAAGTMTKTTDGMYKALSTNLSGDTYGVAISGTKNFNESLQYQWLTTEALTTALGKYADETTDVGRRATKAATQVTTFAKLADTLKETVGSGWAQTFEIIIGDFNEGRELWTSMNDVMSGTIDQISDLRNDFLSEGLSSGWKQFIKEGITDAEEFSAALTEVAKSSGVNIEDMIKRTGSMQKAIKEGWLTGEMLIRTVDKMSSSIEELSVEELSNAGYTEKARSELLKLRDALVSGSISADDFAQKMSKMSGRENIIQGLKNSAIALLTAIKPLSEAFDDIFPPKLGSDLYAFTELFKLFTSSLILTSDTTLKLRRTFRGLFAVVDIGWQIFKFLGASAREVLSVFLPLSGGLLDMTANVGDFLVILNELIKRSQIFEYGLIGVKISAILLRNAFEYLIKGAQKFIYTLLTTDKPLEYLAETLQNIFKGIFGGLGSTFDYLSEKITSALRIVQDILSSDENSTLSKSSILGGALSLLKELVDFLLGGGINVLSTFSALIGGFDFTRIATFVAGGSILLLIFQLSSLAKSLGGLSSSLDVFVKKMSKRLFGSQTKILDIAYAIGILSASLFVLSTIPWSDMKKGLLGLAGAMVIFVGAYAAIQAITVVSSKQLKGIEAIKSSMNLLSLAGSLAILSTAIARISKIDDEEIWKSVGVVGALMGFLTAYQALSVLISILPGTRASNMKITSMSMGLLSLVSVILILDKMSGTSIMEGLAKLSGIVLMLSAIQALFALTSRISGGNKISFNIMGMVGGLLSILVMTKVISLFDNRTLIAGAKRVFLLGGLLAGIQAMFGLASRISGGVRAKTNMLAIQVGLIGMITLSAILGSMDPKKIQNGIKNLSKLTGIVIAIEVLTAVAARIGGGHKLNKILGSVTLTMASFAILIGMLSAYEQSSIDKGLRTILKMTGIIAAIEMLTALSSRIRGSGSSLSSLIGIIGAIVTLTGSLLLLSIIDQTALRQASVSLAISVGAVAGLSIGVSALTKIFGGMSVNTGGLPKVLKNLLPGLTALGVLLLATIAFMGIVNLSSSIMNNVQWETLTKFTFGLGLITTLVGGYTALSKLSGLGGGMRGLTSLVPGLIATSSLIVATAGLFLTINGLDPILRSLSDSTMSKFLIGIDTLGKILTTITLLGPIFMLLGYGGFLPMIAGAASAILAMSLVVASVVALASALEGIFGGSQEFLTGGIDKLIIVGEGIGRFVGAIAGGFGKEVLIQFGEGLAEFSETIASIKPDSFSGVESMARAMLILTSSAVVDGLRRIFISDENPGEIFGKQIKGLLEAFEGISVSTANNAANVFSALGPMVENLSALASAAKDIPNTGGLLGEIVGNNDVDDFGERLRNLISTFKNIDPVHATHASSVLHALTPMAENLKTFAKAADKIPNSGGFIGAFMGENDIDDFGEKLKSLVYTFASINASTDVKLATASLEGMLPMVQNLHAFSVLANNLPNSGGMVSWFTGDNDIEEFTVKLSDIVRTFANLESGELSGATANLITMATYLLPNLERFITLSNSLDPIGRKESFSALGEEIKSFVKILSKVDLSVVGPALKSLDDINASFMVVGETTVSSALESISNNKQPFQSGFVSLIESAIKGVREKNKDLNDTLATLLSDMVRTAENYIDDFVEIGENIGRGLRLGITREKDQVLRTTKDMVDSVVFTGREVLEINSPSKVFEDIGGWIPAGLARGIQKNAKVASIASGALAYDVEGTFRKVLEINSPSKVFESAGSWIPPGVANGIENTKSTLLNTAESLGVDTGNITTQGISDGIEKGEGIVTSGINSLLDLLSGKSLSEISSDLGLSAGSGFGSGFESGLSDGQNGIKKSLGSLKKDAFQIFKEIVDKKREFDLISAWEEIELWQDFTTKYKEGTEVRMKADKHLATLRFTYSKKYIEQETYYKRLSLEEELKAWERVQSRYKEGHEYRLQAEREIFRLKNEIWAAEYKASVDRIDEEKYYGRMNLTQELAEWKKILKTTKEYSDERKKANREIFRLENEIKDTNLAYEEELRNLEQERQKERTRLAEEYYTKERNINDKLKRDIESLNDSYQSAVEQRANTLYSTHGLFDKVEKPKHVSSFELIMNLEDQNTEFDKWQNSIGALAAKGVDEGLIKELREMGPKSLAQINALNRLSDSELTRYQDLWKKKTRETKEQAVSEMVELKQQTEMEIQNLTSAASTELSYYRQVWNNSLRQLDEDNSRKLTELATAWTKSIGNMTGDGITLITTFKKEWFGEMTGIVSKTSKQVQTLSDLLKRANSMAAAAKAAKEATEAVVNAPKTDIIGAYAADGIVRGVQTNTSSVSKAMKTLGTRMLIDLNRTLAINSPSRKTMEVGKFMVFGIRDGIGKFASQAINASSALGDALVNSLDTDMTTSITPIVDLSKVDENSAYDSIAGLDVSSIATTKVDVVHQNGTIAAMLRKLIEISQNNNSFDLNGTLTVQVENDQGEIASIAELAIKDILRRESR